MTLGMGFETANHQQLQLQLVAALHAPKRATFCGDGLRQQLQPSRHAPNFWLLQRHSAFRKLLNIWQNHCSLVGASCPDWASHGSMGLRWTASEPIRQYALAHWPGKLSGYKCIELDHRIRDCSNGCAAHVAHRLLYVMTLSVWK